MQLSLRLVALLFAVLVAMTASARLERGESSVPLSASSSFSLESAASGVSKSDVADALAVIADQASATIALVSLGPDPDPSSPERVLYTFGSNSAIAPDAPLWYSPERNGGVRAFDASQSVPIDGQFVVWGAADVTSQVQAWANPLGIEVTPQRVPTASQMTVSALFTGSAFVPLLALMLASLVLLLVSVARQSSANTQKLLNGVSVHRIAWENAGRMLLNVLVPGLLGVTVAVVLVAVRSGVAYLPVYAAGVAHLMLPYFAFVVVAAITLTLVAWPDVRALANRTSGMRHVVLVAESTKAVSIVITMLLLPATILGVVNAQQYRDEGALWGRFAGAVSVNGFGTVAGSEEDAAAGSAFRDLVTEAGSTAQLVMDADDEFGFAPTALGRDFDALAVVSPSYLATALGSTAPPASLTRELPVEQLPSPIAAALEATLPLQLTESARAQPFEHFRPAVLAETATLPIVTGRYQRPMELPRQPLLLVVEDPSVLDPNFLLAAASSSGVIFTDESSLRQLLDEHGLASSAQGIDDVATRGLLDLQERERTVWFSTVALVVLLLSTTLCLWVSARAYVLANVRRFVPFKLSGVGFARTFRLRLLWELTLVAAATLAAAITAAALQAAPAVIATTCIVGVVAAGLSIGLHRLEFRTIVSRGLSRRAT